MSVCSSCGRPIVWVTTQATGKAMPCDPEVIHVLDGVTIEGARSAGGIDGDGRSRRGPRVDCPVVQSMLARSAEEPRAVAVRVSHFATCPDAPSFRKAGCR